MQANSSGLIVCLRFVPWCTLLVSACALSYHTLVLSTISTRSDQQPARTSNKLSPCHTSQHNHARPLTWRLLQCLRLLSI